MIQVVGRTKDAHQKRGAVDNDPAPRKDGLIKRLTSVLII